MANLVNAENLTKARGTAVLLQEASLGIADGDRVGVVGRNGGGKTTLLRVLTRIEPPDGGRVTHARGLRTGLLAQTDDLPVRATVRDLVLAEAGAEHEWAGDARIREVLDGLGLTGLGLDAPVAPMSGGERRRVALAALLVADPDLLALDEPTNHLDVEGVDWLARHLLSRRSSGRGALVVVTHDRWFLDAVATTTWEVADGSVRSYDGGYSAYVLARAERERTAAASEARRQNLLRKELAWLRRGPPARTSKPRFRIEAAQALIAGEPEPRDFLALQSFATTRLGKAVYDVEDVTLAIGGRTLLRDATWRIGPGDRVAVVGANGSGKTTLLRLLLGELAPQAGAVRVGRTVRPAYLSQTVTELDPALRVLEAVEQVARMLRVGDRELSASQLLERFGFGGARQWTPVGELSGGERRRLQLLRLLMSEPNVLVLDEPTNDLDIDTLTALEDLLDGWVGTLIVVSHDRYFVERVTDTVVALLGDERLVMLVGGVEDYLRRRADAAAVARGAGSASGAGSGGGAGAARSAAGGSDTRSGGDTRTARRELARLERQVAKLERRERELHVALAESATDYERVAVLDAELRAVVAERAVAEDSWLTLSEQLPA